MNHEDYYFPYENIREEQDKLLNKVIGVLKNKRHLIVHAPTGIGKTISTIGPALKVAIDRKSVV